MQSANKIQTEHTAKIINFKTRKAMNQQIDNLQDDSQKKNCFRSDQRYYCHKTECTCWNECQKLVAAWMR